MKIAVLLGGTSSERDVSLASGFRIVDALRRRGHEVVAIDPATGVIAKGGEAKLREAGVKREPPSLEALAGMTEGSFTPTLLSLRELRDADVVFLALHGGQGEDGTIQAMLDTLRIRYTGSGHLASALAMDKDLTKIVLRSAGVQTADWRMASREAGPADAAAIKALGLPIVVKPSKQGSTVGLSVVKTADALRPAINEAFRYDDEVMLEQFIAGRELTVAVLDGEAFPVGEIIPKHEIYDYECKYTAGMAVEEFPAKITPAQAADAQRQAVLAFRALKLGGCARIDFRMNEQGEMYCLEANTLPGMTELSLVPQAAAAAGINFDELCERIARSALGTGAGK